METLSSSLGRVVDGVARLVSRGRTVFERLPIPALRSGPRAKPVVPDVRVDPASVPYFRREVFPSAGPVPWLDRPDALERIAQQVAAGTMTDADAILARAWVRDGYVILPGLYSRSRLDAVWADYEAAIAQGRTTVESSLRSDQDRFLGRALNPHFTVPALDEMLRDRQIVDVVQTLLGVTPLPFQTIAGHKSSEQLPHSDSIHMTTYPLGYLIASWTAFEDIHPDSGPLVYYPGSHRLPYLTSRDVGICVDAMQTSGYVDYHAKYEPAIAREVARSGLEPAYFTPRAGDVLLWHANLVHGGSPRRALEHSRKALVCHYFAEGCLTYHDLSAGPSHVLAGQMRRRRA